MLTRRATFAGASLGLGLIANGIAGQAWAATLGWTPAALSLDQARTVDVVAELIMPATDSPGARAAGVPQFVDRALKDWCDPAQAKRLRTGLDRMDADAKAQHGAAFAACTPAQQSALVARYDAEPQPNGFAQLRELVLIGYFTSKPGATIALRYDPVPGDYRGCVPLKDIGRAWAT